LCPLTDLDDRAGDLRRALGCLADIAGDLAGRGPLFLDGRVDGFGDRGDAFDG